MVMSCKLRGEGCTRNQFTGKERDTETGLDYFGARYYDATIGRFLSVDPHANSYNDITPYHYCHNNPLNRIDPTGMDDKDDERNIWEKIKETIVDFFSSILPPFNPPDPNNPPTNVDTKSIVDEVTDDEETQDAATVILQGTENRQQPPKPDPKKKIIEDIVSGKSKDIKKLTDNERKLLEEVEAVDVHELKGGKSSKFDLYKDREGNIYIFRKGGKGEGEYTGYNINDLKK